MRNSTNQGPQFSQTAEFRAEPRNLVFTAESSRGISRGIRLFSAGFVLFPRISAEFDVFHSNNLSLTENDLKVVVLQVCLH